MYLYDLTFCIFCDTITVISLWFKSLWKKKTTTVITTTTTIAISYSISISGSKIEAKPFDKNKKYDSGEYYIAIADTDDQLLYIAPIPIDSGVALSILISPSYVKSAHKGSNKSFVVSLYSPDPTGLAARSIATSAGNFLGSPGAILHLAKRTGYFDHYHPGNTYTDLSHPHVFFGMPKS